MIKCYQFPTLKLESFWTAGQIFQQLHCCSLEKLYYRSLEINKTSTLKIDKRNFNKFMILSKEINANLYWWKSNIIGSFVPILSPNLSIVLNTYSSLTGWVASIAQQHINIGELKAALSGLKVLCNNFHNIHILVQTDNSSAVAAINKIVSTRSIDVDQVVHLIRCFILRHDNWGKKTLPLPVFLL